MCKVVSAGCSMNRKVVFFFEATDVLGPHVFSASLEDLPALKEQAEKIGGILEKDTPDELRYTFKREGLLVEVEQLATRYMQA